LRRASARTSRRSCSIQPRRAILRIITERGEAGAGEIGGEVGINKATVNNWLPLLIDADKIETTTPSRVAKNVKYCLKGNAPSPEESQLRKLKAQAAGPNPQAVLKMIVERGEATTTELSAEMGSRPEVVAKWLRPLKLLGLIEQIDDRTGGVKRTYYRPRRRQLTRPTGRRLRGRQEESSGLREHPRSRARFGHERRECDQAAPRSPFRRDRTSREFSR
jgi:transcription initiation factor IIE alpha subunit